MHPRRLIREYVVNMLIGGVPAIGGHVFKSRIYPLQKVEVPGFCVYTLRETSEDLDLDGTEQRDPELAIDAYARDREAPDDELDDYCWTVEGLMKADPTLGGLVQSHRLVDTVFGYDGQGEKANGVARLRYGLTYLKD